MYAAALHSGGTREMPTLPSIAARPQPGNAAFLAARELARPLHKPAG